MNRPSESRVTVRRVLQAAPDEVFAYFSDADALARWFFAGEVTRCEVENDFTVGGRYRIRTFGPDDELDEHSGRWLEIAPDRRLRLSWLHADSIPSLVTFDFRPAEGGTWLEVRHEELPNGEDGLYRGGWTQYLGNLTRVLEP